MTLGHNRSTHPAAPKSLGAGAAPRPGLVCLLCAGFLVSDSAIGQQPRTKHMSPYIQRNVCVTGHTPYWNAYNYCLVGDRSLSASGMKLLRGSNQPQKQQRLEIILFCDQVRRCCFGKIYDSEGEFSSFRRLGSGEGHIYQPPPHPDPLSPPSTGAQVGHEDVMF